MYRAVPISSLRKGTLFLFQPVAEKTIPAHLMFQRGEYNRSTKTYKYFNYVDYKITGETKRDTLVYV